MVVPTPEFVRAHTRPAAPSVVPELQLAVAEDVVALWEAMHEGVPEGVPGDAGSGASDEPPFWAAAWPGGQALARYVLDHPEVVAGRPVLDLGAGSGLVAIAALRAGATSAVASDPDPCVPAAVAVNAELNGVPRIEVVGDVLDDDPPVDAVVLAGDVCYDRAMTARVLPYLFRAWVAGCTVLLGDPGRPYLPTEGLVAVAGYDVPDAAGGASSGLVRRTTVWRLP